MINSGILTGMVIGAVIGAILTEANPPINDIVQKGKKCVKQKIDAVANSVKN